VSSYTYPNGQVLTSTALTDDQVQKIFQTLTSGLLGMNPPDYSKVRVDWQTEGQPFQNAPEQVVYVAATTEDEEYTRIRNKTQAPIVAGGFSQDTYTYTRGWRVAWTAYGPNAVDWTRAIKSGTFMDWFNWTLNQSNLYPIPDPPEPVRAPEEINGQWFNRSDFYLLLYENVTETILTPLVKSVEVQVYTDKTLAENPIADITIKPSEG
jgi:hypothetical protein